MTRNRKWLLPVGLVALAIVAAACTWGGMNLTNLKASYAARQLRCATSDEDRTKAIDRLAALGSPGTAKLVQFILAGDEPGRAAAGALERVLTASPEGEPQAIAAAGQLLDAFPTCDVSGQRAILELLPTMLNKTGHTHAEKCRSAVAEALKKPDPTARVMAARLAIHPHVRLQKELLPLLVAPEAEVRRAALIAVASVTDSDPLLGDEELFRWLHDPDEGVRKVCRDALVSRDRSEVEIGLGSRLTDPDPLERLKLLADLRYDDDVADPEPWLERLSRDPEPAIRAGAARVAIEIATIRRLSCPGWVARLADADSDATVRFVANFFRNPPARRVDPNFRQTSGP